MTNEIDILGTKYKILVHKTSDDESLKNNSWSGYCNSVTKTIVVADLNESEYYNFESEREKELTRQEILRHEINHAFFNESGLGHSSLQYSDGWAVNEEMVDWIAIQAPKLFKAYKEAGVI
jgi:hypothetical protein